MTQKSPFFSIIIPTYDHPGQLATCLESLACLDYPGDRFEVIVVDDGSETPPKDVVTSFDDRLNVTLLTQPNAGPAAARNTGAALARGEYLAFTDDDCAPHPYWVQNFATCFEKTPDCIIGGKTVNILTDNLYASTSQLIVDIVYNHYNANPNQAHFFASNNLAVPAQRFRDIGAFNPSFRASEDRELCDRWLHHGYRMIFVPEAVLYHAHTLTLTRFLRQHFYYGCGAYRFHQIRARRGSGRFQTEFKFHLNFRNWLLYPFSQTPLHRVLPLAALMVVWQIANAAGFFWEAIHQKMFCSRQS